VFPWASHYDLHSLPQFEEIKSTLSDIAKYVKRHNIRLTFHPAIGSATLQVAWTKL
jgi:UV DNA damage repair endonuclease